MWNRLALVEPPAVPPLTLVTAKQHLRVDGGGDDADVTAALNDAAAYIDGPNGKGLALITQTWALSLGGFEADPIVIPLWPVQSVETIEYLDSEGETQTIDPAACRIDLAASPVEIHPGWGASWPAVRCGPGAVTVTFKAGFGDAPADIPGTLGRAVRLLVGHYFNNREGAEMPPAIDNLISRYAVGTI